MPPGPTSSNAAARSQSSTATSRLGPQQTWIWRARSPQQRNVGAWRCTRTTARRSAPAWCSSRLSSGARRWSRAGWLA
eukprot:8291007-Pyramimonas_sp.AAC.1